MGEDDREIEMLTPTTRSGHSARTHTDQDALQQGMVGAWTADIETAEPSTIEPSTDGPTTIESTSSMAKNRRWLPLAAAGILGLSAALALSRGADSGQPTDPDTSADSEDQAGVIDPIELDSPLVDGPEIGPDSLELVAPIGEFVGHRAPVASRYGQVGPVEYSVILASSTSDLRLIDLGTGAESVLSNQRSLTLATDRLVITSSGLFEANGSTWLTEIATGPKRDSDQQPDSPYPGQAQELGSSGLASFAAESSAEFWTVENFAEKQLLQLRRLPEGLVVQAFETPILEWRFTGGIPIGSVDGGIYQLAPGSGTGVRRVADAELVDADSGRALIRTCATEQGRCDYQWLDRANWAPLDLPIPPPDSAHQEHSRWRIGGGGRWLINPSPGRQDSDGSTGLGEATPIKLIDLRNGRTLSLVLGAEDLTTGIRSMVVSSDGNWLATRTDSELVVVNLATGEQFRSTLAANNQVVGLIRTAPFLSGDPTGTGTNVMTLSGFERDGQPPLEALGHSILATGWLGTGALVDLATGESQGLDGVAEAKLITESTVVGLGPSNDLVSVSLEDGSRSSRFLGAVENLSILPGPDTSQVWLGSSGPGIMNLTSGLALVASPSLTLREQHDFRILTWHLGGEAPLGTSLGSIWRYSNNSQQVEQIRSGILVTAAGDIALVWECPNGSVTNQENPLDDSHPRDEDGCAFVWRSSGTWEELDLALPPNPSGVSGIFGSGRWLLTYASPNESQLVELETGRAISFGANWTDFLDVSPDGRWAIHRTRADHLVLSDLDSAVYDNNGQADHAELVTYEMSANQKIASVKFLPVAE